MRTRSLIQKLTLANSLLQTDWCFGESKDWNSALNMPLVTSLQGLRHLWLQIDHSVAAELVVPIEYIRHLTYVGVS